MENRSKNYSFWIFKKGAIVFKRLNEIQARNFLVFLRLVKT